MRALWWVSCSLARVTGNNNVRSQIEIVEYVTSPFFWQIACMLSPKVKSARLMLERLPMQTFWVLSRKSLRPPRPASIRVQLRGNLGKSEV